MRILGNIDSLLTASCAGDDIILQAEGDARRAATAAADAEHFSRVAQAETTLHPDGWAELAEAAATRCSMWADMAGLHAPESRAHREALRSYALARMYATAARRAANARQKP